MRDIIKNVLKKMIPFFVCVGLLLLPRGCIGLILFIDGYGRVYTTNSLSDYGTYKGNFDNDVPTEFITSFFPDRIEEHFSDVRYHYKAIRLDAYGYEAYLEFTIEDRDAFTEYIRNEIPASDVVQFAHDPSFCEITVSDILDATPYDEYICLESAKLGKILWSVSEGTVIYWAMGVHDGGATRLEQLDHFLHRFQIDHVDFVTAIGESGWVA